MKAVIGLLLGAVLLLGGYTWLVLHWSYSAGERAGYVQKFSLRSAASSVRWSVPAPHQRE